MHSLTHIINQTCKKFIKTDPSREMWPESHRFNQKLHKKSKTITKSNTTCVLGKKKNINCPNNRINHLKSKRKPQIWGTLHINWYFDHKYASQLKPKHKIKPNLWFRSRKTCYAQKNASTSSNESVKLTQNVIQETKHIFWP